MIIKYIGQLLTLEKKVTNREYMYSSKVACFFRTELYDASFGKAKGFRGTKRNETDCTKIQSSDEGGELFNNSEHLYDVYNS